MILPELNPLAEDLVYINVYIYIYSLRYKRIYEVNTFSGIIETLIDADSFNGSWERRKNISQYNEEKRKRKEVSMQCVIPSHALLQPNSFVFFYSIIFVYLKIHTVHHCYYMPPPSRSWAITLTSLSDCWFD